MPDAGDITELLLAWNRGQTQALEKLIPLIHSEPHRLAHLYMRQQRPGHALQTTALVNEACVRLVDCNRVEWHDRAHFLAVSANLVRRILVGYARLAATWSRLTTRWTPWPSRIPGKRALSSCVSSRGRTLARAWFLRELRAGDRR